MEKGVLLSGSITLALKVGQQVSIGAKFAFLLICLIFLQNIASLRLHQMISQSSQASQFFSISLTSLPRF